MTRPFRKIKDWFQNWKFKLEHNNNAKRLNSELEKAYYKSNSTDIIKILFELDKKAGLSSYDIVPFLKRIKLMPYRNSFVEKGSGGAVTDRHRNDELFKELEQLDFIRIIENKLFSESRGTRYKTPAEECVLKVKLLPKGIDYLIEYKKRKKDYRFAIITIVLLFMTALFSIPQACNNWEQYQTLKGAKKNEEMRKFKSNIKENDSTIGRNKNKLENGVKPNS
ncbi:hypothetical protein ACH3O9_14755 [Leeuwenhoekiella sp. A16]|uniref:hypothetical protein n=1 Tax=unclassified Leeuwenhoekiella TaxID=2615029 RepID=UPI003A80BBB4